MHINLNEQKQQYQSKEVCCGQTSSTMWEVDKSTQEKKQHNFKVYLIKVVFKTGVVLG